MTNENIKTYSNPDLLVGDGNKAKWNNPKYRREGFRNLHKINRYGFYLRSDQVLLLEKDINLKIGNNNLLQKMTNHKSFCSVVFAKNNKIIYEKYAKDFSENQPHTIQSIPTASTASSNHCLKGLLLIFSTIKPKTSEFADL